MARHEPLDNADNVSTEATASSWWRNLRPATRTADPTSVTQTGFSSWGLAASGVTVLILGVVMYITLIVTGQPDVGLLFLLPMVVSAGALYLLAMRRRQRDELGSVTARAVANHLAVSPASRVQIGLRGWHGAWVGTPGLINVRYPKDVDGTTPTWAASVAKVIEEALKTPYAIVQHNPKFRRVTFRDTKIVVGETPTTEAAVPEQRAARRSSRLPDKIDRPRPSDDRSGDWLVPLGIDESGTTTAWDLAGPHGHLLVMGRSGSGKRILVTGVAIEIARRGWPVWVIDHRRIELLGLRDWPNIQIVASTLDDQVVVLNQAWREMESRIAMIESGTNAQELEPLVVVIHHYREFAMAVAEAAERAGQGTSAAGIAQDRVKDLMRHGRSVHVYLVLSIQRMDDPLLQPEFREKLGAIVAMGRIDSSAAAVLWGGDGTEDFPDPVPGRAVIKVEDGTPVDIQCYWTPDPREARRNNNEQDLYLVETLRPSLGSHPVLHVQRPRPLTDGPGGTWKANLAAELTEGFTPSGSALAEWSRTRNTDHDASMPAGAKATAGWSEVVMVSQLESGNLARLDDEHGWVIVEHIEPVHNDPSRLHIQWRGHDGDGSIDVPRTQIARIRHVDDGVY